MSDTKSPMQELNTKQYYETVDVAELPEQSGRYFAIDKDGECATFIFDAKFSQWKWPVSSGAVGKHLIVSWLRPVSLSELIREVATPAPVASPSSPTEGEDEFIQKHLVKVMEMTADSFIKTHIEKMYGGLQMASVKYFLESGSVSGSLYMNLKDMMMKFAKNWHTTAATPSSLPPAMPVDDIYDSVYMEVVKAVEDDNIQGEMYSDTIEKLKQLFIIQKR